MITAISCVGQLHAASTHKHPARRRGHAARRVKVIKVTRNTGTIRCASLPTGRQTEKILFEQAVGICNVFEIADQGDETMKRNVI